MAGSRGLLAQHHLGLALQHAARGLRQLQRAERLAVGLEMPHGHQLAQGGAPLLFIELAPYSKYGKLVMAELPDALRHAADQYVDEVHRPKTLPGAIGAGQQLLRDDLAIANRRRRETV